MDKKNVTGAILSGLAGLMVVIAAKETYDRFSKTDQEETRIFTDFILSSDVFTIDEINQIEDFVRFLYDQDKENRTDFFRQFRRYIANGVNSKSTINFTKNLLSKSSNKERYQFCETFSIWKLSLRSEIAKSTKEFRKRAKEFRDNS